MKQKRYTWVYIVIMLVITAVLGVVGYLTMTKLNQTAPVAPNVPQVKPKAAVDACTLSFSITPNTPTNTPTLTPTVSVTVTNTPTNTPTATPTSTVGCNESCTVNTDCNSGTVCADGKCRNPQCTEQASCQCVINTPTNTPSATPTPQVGCNSGCTVNTDCSSGLVCIDSACRNPSCTEKTSCQCDVASTPTPQTPVAGTGPSVLGASIIAGGFLFILFGLAL